MMDHEGFRLASRSRLANSRSTASRKKSARFSLAARAPSTRANVPAGNRASASSWLTLLRPTDGGLADIVSAVKIAPFVISPIDLYPISSTLAMRYQLRTIS